MTLPVPVLRRMLTALKWYTKSGNGHCLVQLLCRCSTLAVESSGLNWVLQEGILCDVFSQKCSAAWQGARGERLTVAIMLPGRQDADDWLNFMLSQKNLWPTFTTRVLSLKRFPHRSLVESGTGYRPSICGWRSSCGGECWLTECTPGLPLGSPKKNLKPCCLTGLPRKTTRIRMKKNHIGVLQSKRSKHGGNHAKSGWQTSKDKLRHWSSTSRVFWGTIR